MNSADITPKSRIHALKPQEETVVRMLLRTGGAQGRIGELQTFGREHDIAPEFLISDGRRLSLPGFADVALLHDHRFTFQRHLKEPAAVHRAIVYRVLSEHGDDIDLVAIIPSMNKAAFFFGIRGAVGVHQLAYRRAKRGIRVFRDPMQYLRQGRNGILLVDPAKAAVELRGKLPVAETIEDALDLARLGFGTPTILVRPLRRRWRWSTSAFS